MKTIREQFEEIWPAPEGIEWSMNIGRYVCNDDILITQECVNKAIEWDTRLDTFTRFQKSQAIVTSLNDELLEACELHINTIRSQLRDGVMTREYVDAIYEAQNKMIAAIAKARGQL